jgi:two-component system, NarL family, sensor kinase
MLLLSEMAREVGVAAQAVRLTAELQHSRERLVTAREEERRRLRRDLHDGVGPLLAGVVLQLGAAKTLLTQDPDAVSGLLDMLRGETQDAIAGIRRIAYDLRPSVLDDLGLVGALREQAAHFTTPAGDDPSAESLTVTVDGPESLPALPAAVEVARRRSNMPCAAYSRR